MPVIMENVSPSAPHPAPVRALSPGAALGWMARGWRDFLASPGLSVLHGAPPEDRVELFGRMVFNAVCGNDDDHVRNHAVVYQAQEGRWRLAPAFDAVPNTAQMPARLAMQLSAGRFDISRESVLADAARFGFDSRPKAERHLNELLARIEVAFDTEEAALDPDWRRELRGRVVAVLRK